MLLTYGVALRSMRLCMCDAHGHYVRTIDAWVWDVVLTSDETCGDGMKFM